MKSARELSVLAAIPADRLQAFDDWLYTRGGRAGIEALVRVAVAKAWGFEAQGEVRFCLVSRAQLDRVRSKAIHLMLALDEWPVVVDKTEWRTDGKRLWAVMAN